MKNKNVLILAFGIIFTIMSVLLMTKNTYVPLAIISLLAVIVLYLNSKLAILVLVCLNERLFYLVDKDSLPSEVLVTGVVLILFLMLMIIKSVNNHIGDEREAMYFKGSIILLALIPVLSGISANICNGQPFALGVSSVKKYYIYLFYFYLINTIKSVRDINRIEFILIYLGTILSICFIIQSLQIVDIFKVTICDSRNGMLRFFDGYTFIMISYLISLSKIFDVNINKIDTLRYIIASSICFVSIVTVSQTRNFIICILICSIGVFIGQKKYKKTPLILFFIFLGCILIMFNVEFESTNLITTTISDARSGVGTIGFRYKEIEFYLNGFLESPLLGKGYYSGDFGDTYIITGEYQRFFQEDVAVFGYLFHTGVVGVLILMYLLFRIFKMALKLKESRSSGYNLGIAISLYLISGCFTTFFIHESKSILYIAIILAIIEGYYRINRKGGINLNE